MNKMQTESPLLRIEDLAVSFDGPTGAVRAVTGVNLSIYPQQTLAVVGESGCGKSVTALSMLQLVPTPPGRYESGRILWVGDGQPVDLRTYSDKQMRHIRGNKIAMIFQEPMTSLNPVYTIGEQILEAILLHQKVSRSQAIDIAAEALADVGLSDGRLRLKEYPHQLSGGMRQRVMIAMALACQPKLLIADEPTTALDVTIQAQILELLRALQERRDMAVLLITHDLGVVAQNADVVAVMYAGRVVEYGQVHDVFEHPIHPYTQALFESMPVLGQERHRLITIPGNVPNPADFPTGCAFHPRCAHSAERAKTARGVHTATVTVEGRPVTVMANCTKDTPGLLEVADQHWVACSHAQGYDDGATTIPDVPYRRSVVSV